MRSEDRYDSTKDLEVEARRRAKISASRMGQNNNPRGNPLGPNAHRSGCACGWHIGSNQVGKSNANWRGGPVNSNGVGWSVVSRGVRERDKVCRACELPPSLERQLDVHHVIPRRDGGSSDPNNLVALHHGCHMKVEVGKMKILPRPIIGDRNGRR